MEVLMASRSVVAEIPGALALMEDGSVERFPSPMVPVPSSPDDFINGVVTKDVAINPCTGTWARIFLPHGVVFNNNRSNDDEDDEPDEDNGGVPVVLHFHGGGMCLGSPSDPVFHNFCSRMASKSNSIWISVSYRLAPEHRIPIQYQDCFEAICWLRSQFTSEKLSLPSSVSLTQVKEPWEVTQSELLRVCCSAEKDPWLAQHANPSKVFLTGESAGATILHFLALHLGKYQWSPLEFGGFIYVDIGVMADPLPEMKPSTDPKLTTQMMAASVRLCLPEGAKLGHPLLNCLHPSSPSLSTIKMPPSLVLVSGADLLYEDGVSYYTALKEAGKEADIEESPGMGHCFHLQSPNSEVALAREQIMAEFILR